MSSEGSSCIKLETRTLIFGVSFSRNPSYIKAYFIYGIVMAVLCSAVMVGIAIVVESFIVALVSFVILILYSLILHMVNLTRQKISGEVFALENKRLTDTIF